MGFRVIESKEEFFAVARARMLWGNRGCPDEAPRRDHLYYWDSFDSIELSEIWDSAANNTSNVEEWRTQDFAVLVEDDEEGDSTTASEEGDSTTTVSEDYQL